MESIEIINPSLNGTDNVHAMKLRPRRSALSDISNSIAQQISNITKKVIPRKRRLSGAPAGTEESTASETHSTTQDTASSPAPSTTSAQGQHLNELVDMVNNPAAFVEPAAKRMKTQEEKESEFYGFRIPPRINRKVALQTKSADPRHCVDILDDIYAFYNELHDVYHARNMMTRNIESFQKMRTILIDWILEVHHKYRLQLSTLWLTVSIIDRFLVKEPVPRQRMQLAGITALFIACKFEEIHSPEVRDCVYLTDNVYTRQDVIDMENQILTSIDYQLHVPTAYHFMVRFLNRIGATDRLRHMAHFTAERSLQENDIFNCNCKVYAAAAVYVALRTAHADKGSEFNVWTPALQEESGLKEEDIFPYARLMSIRNNEIPPPSTSSRRKIEAVKKKYSEAKYHFISNITFPTL